MTKQQQANLDAWGRGKQAYLRGIARDNSPKGERRGWWRIGWDNACRDHEETQRRNLKPEDAPRV